MRVRQSTRVRILGWVLLPVLVVLVGSWFAAWWLLTQRLDERIDTELTGEVSELRLLAGDGVDPRTGSAFADVADLLELHIERSIPDPNETMFVIVDGQVVSRSSDRPPVRLDLDDQLVAAATGVDEVTFGNSVTAAGDVRWVAVPVQSGDQRGVFVVGIFADLEGADLAQVMGRFAAFGVIALLLAAGVGWLVAGRVLRPLRDMRDTAQSITDEDLSRRIPISADTTGDEVAALAATFNDMLDRLEDAFAAQRAFIDDAGHELRTPLTIAQGHLELIDGDAPQEQEATVALVLDELGRMNRIVRDLQTLTRSHSPGFVHPEPTDLSVLMDELLVKASALGARDWRLDEGPPGTVLIDRQRITQAMMQLAENAVRHTTGGDVIRLSAAVRGSDLVLTVADSGPGIPPDERNRVLQRFHRASDGDGAGLGLALVNAIAQAHHGIVTIGDSDLGGAAVMLTLPRSIQPAMTVMG
jgi:two-component system OmpR family sensor kinase